MTWHVAIENIAGIKRGEATIDEGVNAVRASNWQGKSSFLAAVKAGLGVGKPLQEGADEGSVVLETETDTTTVSFRRMGNAVVRDGPPLLESEYDRVRVQLFGALDETNPVRKAVRNDDNLEALLTKPLDIEDIDATIAETKRRRDSIETELERAETAADRIPSLRERVDELETKYDTLAEKRDRVSTDGATVDRREDLTDLQAERNRIEDRIERLSDTIERIDDRIESQRAELETIDVEDPDDVESELSDVQSEFESIKREADLAQELYTANRRFYEADTRHTSETVKHDLLGETVECWVCGQEVNRDDIEDHLEELKNHVETLQNEAATYEDRIAELEARRDEIRDRRQQKRNLEMDLADMEERRAEREESLEGARERLDDVETEIAELEETVEEETETLTDIESELKYTEAELDDLREELSSLEAEAERREDLEKRRTNLTEKIESLRTRKDRIRRETRGSFKRHMSDLLGQFETGFEAARLTDSFELVVARDGREASLDALSQGERELLGIVAGIAGYEAFDVAADVPILLLDNLGVLTDRNVEILIDHLRKRCDYLVFTSYPEHTAFAGNEIDIGDWSVVSGDETVDTTS
jgi:predicted  nucleic acid-binding Zn-ribbon protein